jgi:hypothetical protein
MDCRGNKKPRRRSGAAAGGNDSSDKYQSAKKGKQNATASVDEKRMSACVPAGDWSIFRT